MLLRSSDQGVLIIATKWAHILQCYEISGTKCNTLFSSLILGVDVTFLSSKKQDAVNHDTLYDF